MKEQQSIFWDTIKIFDELDLLPHVIIIGSWAEYIYENYFNGFKSNLKTMDMDILYPNIRRPNKRINLKEVLEKNDYISNTDCTGITKFYKDGKIEIEFLVREIGRGQSEPYKIEPLGIKAEGLREMTFIESNSIDIIAQCYKIRVPSPQAYVLHKLIINDKRKNKAQKDIRAVEGVLKFIKKSDIEKTKLKEIYESLSNKEKRKIDKVCDKEVITLF